MNADEPKIVEQDGNIVRIIAGEVEVIAEMTRGPDELLFDRLSIDGAGPGTLGMAKLKWMARQFAKTQGVSRIRVRGTVRTTGANPGKTPREIVIRV